MELPRPDISIITVIKDDIPGLSRTLQSLERVSSPRIEVVVMDGTLNSDIMAVVKDLKSTLHIQATFLTPAGIYNAMNAGAHNARGEWLWFLNAGDYCVASKEQFQELLDSLDTNHDEIVGVVTPVAITTHDGHIYDIALPTIFEGELHCNHQGVLVRRGAYEQIGGFDENLRMAADGKFLDSLLQIGEIKEIRNVITAFVMGGRSAKNFKVTLEEIETYRKKSTSNKSKLLLKLKTTLRNQLLTKYFMNYTLLQKYLKHREKKVRETYQSIVELPLSENVFR